jgi:Rhodopirellula transposase DDE domain
MAALEQLVSPLTRGDPESVLRWTCKSTYKLGDELQAQGYRSSHTTVGKLLAGIGYSLQAPCKTQEGGKHEDRDAQFGHINAQAERFQRLGWPTISVDTKKKENMGNFSNKGREYQPKGRPEEVNVYDFIDKKKGKVAPYGVYDMGRNEGFVNVGISKDTAEFAVHSIRKWWHRMGAPVYGGAPALLVTADCGGSNGNRVRLWKVELQRLANELKMEIHVCHFPSGTSKWNKIEHRMFCHISENWRGRPLISRQVVVQLIGSTKTEKGLTICADLDENVYEKGRKISASQLAEVSLVNQEFHGEWNYIIKPQLE